MKDFHDFGCPHTEQRSRRVEFEKEHPGLDLHMKPDAPHFSARDTRIAYDKWADEQKKEKQ